MNPKDQRDKEVKVATREQLRTIRYESSMAALKLSPDQALAQMKQNGSIFSPNPWYRRPGVKGGSLTLIGSDA